jgi:hypothetical protein
MEGNVEPGDRFIKQCKAPQVMDGLIELSTEIYVSSQSRRSLASGLSTRSPPPSAPRDRRGTALVRRKLELLPSCDRCWRGGLFAPAKLAAVDPHTVQDDRQVTGDRAHKGGTATRARAKPRRLAMLLPKRATPTTCCSGSTTNRRPLRAPREPVHPRIS